MSRNDNVMCQCCGKMMVPRVIYSRGLYLGWFMRFGGGHPAGSCCPFCLSENWSNPSAPIEKSVGDKSKLLALCFLGAIFLYVLFQFAGSVFFESGISGSVDMIAQWTFVGFAIYLYRKHRLTKHK